MKTKLLFPLPVKAGLPVLICLMSLLPTLLFAQDWNNCGGNSSRNGLSPIPGPQTPAIKWEGTASGLFGFPVFINDGKVVTSRFISVTNSPVVCHDLNTGQLLWTADVTNGTGRSVPIGMRDGKVYVLRMLEAAFGDSLVTLDAATGAHLWSADKLIKPAYPVGCAFASNGDVLVEGYLTLLRINATDGSTVWETSIYPSVLGHLCPTVFDSTVYVQQNAIESITALDINSGNIKYTIAIEPYGQNAQTILMAGTDGTLYAQTTETGGMVTAIHDNGDSLSVKWTTPVLGYSPFSYMAESPDSTIYAPSNGKIMRMLKTTGAIIDSSQAIGSPGIFIETISIGSDGKVYVACENTFHCMNPDLTPVFAETIPGLNTSGCALGPNNLLAIAGSGTALRVYGLTPTIFASETVVCEKFCISFFDSSTNNPTAWQWIFPGGSPATSTAQNPGSICYTNPGVFDVTLITTSASGNDTVTLPGYITVNPTPPIPVISQVGLTLTSTPASSYQWQLNTIDIPGATNQSYTASQTGLYTVIVGDSNSCNNSASVDVVITAVEDVKNGSNIFVYPNPSLGNFNVELSMSEGDVSIEISDVNGKVLYKTGEKNTSALYKKEIHLEGQPAGVYLVKINTGEKLFFQKMVIRD